MLKPEDLRIYSDIQEYCATYNIPKKNLLEILEDQKVLPMIRGKATEYIGAVVIHQALDPVVWVVEKLNLNPQVGVIDSDIGVTFRRTARRFTVEVKNSVRGKFNTGTRKTKSPHFRVKCHRSRSNFDRWYNDRYLVGDFDVLMCNVSNSIFQGKSLDKGLPLIDNPDAISWLKEYYGITNDSELSRKAYDDWRFCFPVTIALEDGTIPRTPVVLMHDDPNWFGIDKLANNLRSLINRN